MRLALERAREATQAPPTVDTTLSERARSLDVTVHPHGLAGYDALRTAEEPSTDPTADPTADPNHPKDSP